MLSSIPRGLPGDGQSGTDTAYLPPNNTHNRSNDADVTMSREANKKRLSTSTLSARQAQGHQSAANDSFLINFPQFYDLLLKIVQIPLVMFVSLPLFFVFVWCYLFIGSYTTTVCMDSRTCEDWF